MRFPISALTLWSGLTILPAALPAATLLSVSNGLDSSSAIVDIRHTTNSAPSNIFFAVEWTQTVAASNVQVRAAVVSQDGWPADVYITTEIGALATVADVVASSTIDVPATTLPLDIDNPPMTSLFTGLNLSPGTYYLVLATSALSPFSRLNWFGDPSQSATVTSAPGFSLGAGYMYADDPYIAFHPSARFVEYDVARGMFWDLSVPEQVPEPGTLSLLAGGFALIALRRLKNRPTGFRLTGWRQER